MKASDPNRHNSTGAVTPLQDRNGNGRCSFGNGKAVGSVQVEFVGYTHGLLMPEVRVFRSGRELSWNGFTAIVTSNPAVSREMRFREGSVYCAEPILRDLKKYLTAEVFLSRHYSGRHSAFLYLDHHGHPHVRFAQYDFILLAGLAAFLRVCGEIEDGRGDPQQILASLQQCPEAPVYSPFVDIAFVQRCLGLVQRHGLPYRGVRSCLEQRLSSILPRAESLREKATAYEKCGQWRWEENRRTARPIPSGFSLGSLPCATQLVAFGNALQRTGR